MEPKSISKLGLTIIVAIILTTIIVALVNVGLSIFIEDPNYDDFCGKYRPAPTVIDKTGEDSELVCAEDIKICEDGTTLTRDPKMGCEFPSCSEEFEDCQDEWENARDNFNQRRFYFFAGIGFVLLLIGLFWRENLFQITGLASGGILIFEGIVTNFQNKILVFTTLIIILIVFGIIARRVIKKR